MHVCIFTRTMRLPKKNSNGNNARPERVNAICKPLERSMRERDECTKKILYVVYI